MGWFAAAALIVLALGLRVAEVERTAPYHPITDGRSYLALAREVALTGDYPDSHTVGAGAGGSIGPTTYFPPAFPYFLAGVDLLAGNTTTVGQAVPTTRLATAVLGTVAVALVGLVAWEVFGGAVALAALGLAALYPPLIELSGTPYSENLLVVFELTAVWAALRARRASNPYPLLGVAGVFTGLATLTHENAVVILLPLIFCAIQAARRWVLAGRRAEGVRARLDSSLPVAETGLARSLRTLTPRRPRTGRAMWGARLRHAPRRRATRRVWASVLAAPAVLVVMTALMIAPWTIRNALELHRLIPVSDEAGITLAGTYNPVSAANRQIPYKWIYYSLVPQYAAIARSSAHVTEPGLSDRLTSAAFHYIGRHPLAPLQAAYHNLRRLLELEGSAAWRASASSIGLTAGTARIGVFGFWVVAALAAAGVLTRRARRAPQWLWAIPILLAWSVLLVNSETPRFRAPIDPYLLMLAACALISLGARLRSRLARRRALSPSAPRS